MESGKDRMPEEKKQFLKCTNFLIVMRSLYHFMDYHLICRAYFVSSVRVQQSILEKSTNDPPLESALSVCHADSDSSPTTGAGSVESENLRIRARV